MHPVFRHPFRLLHGPFFPTFPITPAKGKPAGSAFSLIIVSVLILALGTICPAGERPDIVIFHIGDIHGHLAAAPDVLSEAQPKPLIGGYAILKTLLDRQKLEILKAGAFPILLDGGDLFTGTPVCDETQGLCMVDVLSRLKATVGTLGNHDFDYGPDAFKRVYSTAGFPIVDCNLFDKRTGRPLEPTRPWVVIPAKGRRIAVIGILTPQTKDISIQENTNHIDFRDPIPILQNLVPKVRERGADMVILLSHMGIEKDRGIASQVRGLDMILGAHSHTIQSGGPEYVGPDGIPLIHSGFDGRLVSRIEVRFDANGKPSAAHRYFNLLASDFPEDPAIKAIIDSYAAPINEKMKEVLGESAVDLFRGIVGGDSPLGSFVADAMRQYSGADFAFVNFGGIRYPIGKGKITLEDLFFLQPFPNTVDVVPMTGAELFKMLEESVSVPFSPVTAEDREFAVQNFKLKASGLKRDLLGNFGSLIPSNLHFTFDPNLPPMKRITKLTDAAGNPIISDKAYTVAFNNYLTQGGDGFKYLQTAKGKKVTSLNIRDLLIRKVREEGGVKQLPEQRVFNIRLETQPLN